MIVGEASVVIRPALTRFAPELTAGIESSVRQVAERVRLRVGADTSTATRQITDGIGQATRRVSDSAKVRVSADTSAAQQSIASLSERVRGLIGSVAGSATRFAGYYAGYQAVSALGRGFSFATDSVFGFNSQLQQATIGFTTMLGSGQRARAFLDQLQAFAAKTPFEFPQLVDISSMMVGMGFAARDVIPDLTAVGDAMSGLGRSADDVKGVTEALGQMKAHGVADAGDLLQLTSRGINAWQILADTMHKSVPEIQSMVSKGMIPANVAIRDIITGLEHGTRNTQAFGGMMSAQSRTFSGAISNIHDALQQGLAAGFRPIFDAASRAALRLSDVLMRPAFQTGIRAIGAATVSAFSQVGHVFLAGAAAADALWRALTPVREQIAHVVGYFRGDAGNFDAGFRGAVERIGSRLAGLPAKARDYMHHFTDYLHAPGASNFDAGPKGALERIAADLAAAPAKIGPALSSITEGIKQRAADMGRTLIAGVTTGVQRGDWGPLGRAIGNGFAHGGIAGTVFGPVIGQVTRAISRDLGHIDWLGLGIAAGKQAPSFFVGLAAGLLNFDFGGLLRGIMHHWQDILVGGLALVFAPSRLVARVGELLLRVPLAEPLLGWLVRGVVRFQASAHKLAVDMLRSLGEGFLRGIGIEAPSLRGALTGLFDRLAGVVRDAAETLYLGGLHAMQRLGGAIAGAGPRQVVSAIRTVSDAFARTLGALGRWLVQTGGDLIGGLWRGMRAVWAQEISWLRQLGGWAFNAVGDLGGTLASRGRDLISGLWGGVRVAWSSTSGWLSGTAGRAARAVGGLGRTLWSAGGDLIGGLLSGARSALSAVGSWAAHVKNAIVGAIKNLFGIHSPSTVFAELGGHMMSGLFQGLLSGGSGVKGIVDAVFAGALGNPAHWISSHVDQLGGLFSAIPGLAERAVQLVPSLLSRAGGAVAGLLGRIFGGGGGSPVLTGGSGMGRVAAQLAEHFLGVPYLWGGESPAGFDCSGLMEFVYNALGVHLPRVARDQQHVGHPVPNNLISAGDLVFFGRPAHHVGMALNPTTMIDAPHTGANVRIESFRGWSDYSGARRPYYNGGRIAADGLFRGHRDEYVLSSDVVSAIRSGGPSRGLTAAAASTADLLPELVKQGVTEALRQLAADGLLGTTVQQQNTYSGVDLDVAQRLTARELMLALRGI